MKSFGFCSTWHDINGRALFLMDTSTKLSLSLMSVWYSDIFLCLGIESDPWFLNRKQQEKPNTQSNPKHLQQIRSIQFPLLCFWSKMHSTNLMLEEPIRMASILEPSTKTVIFNFCFFPAFFCLWFCCDPSTSVLFFLVIMSWVDFPAGFFSCNVEDCGHSGSEIEIAGSYFWLSRGWNVWYGPIFFHLPLFDPEKIEENFKIGRAQHWALPALLLLLLLLLFLTMIIIFMTVASLFWWV